MSGDAGSVLAGFRKYAELYYNERFIEGMGTDQVLEAFQRHSAGVRWLDIGGGTSTLFWSCVARWPKRIHICDLYPEAQVVLNEIIQRPAPPQCYLDVLDRYRLPPEHYHKMAGAIEHFFVMDALAKWPTECSSENYDLVSQFGCFGLARTGEHYIACIEQMCAACRKGGVLFGANWHRSQAYVRQYGGANDYLDLNLVDRCEESLPITVLERFRVPISGDPHYDYIIGWAFKKNGGAVS